VVDDFEPFRRVYEAILRNQPELQIICEVSDGLEAVQKAEELQPEAFSRFQNTVRQPRIVR
jgi:chemotaxis response regulator CheB